MITPKKLLITIFSVAVMLGAKAQSPTEINIVLLGNEPVFTKAPFAQCHASTIAELAKGEIMVAWFGGTHERHPDVCIWGAIKSRKGWSAPVQLADGIVNDTLRYPCWNPVLYKSKKGELFLYYKVGPSPSLWWGMYKKSNDNGRSWSSAIALPSPILGPIKNKPITLKNGRVIAPSSIERGDIWHAHMEISDDGCQTWRKVSIDTTTGYKLIQPTLITLKDGSIKALLRSNQDCLVESISKDGGNTWSKPTKTDIINPNSGVDAVALKNGGYLLVSNPAPAGKDWSDGRNKLILMYSPDGNLWMDIYTLEDHPKGEFSYPAIIQASDGKVHITYTSNRKGIEHVVLTVGK